MSVLNKAKTKPCRIPTFGTRIPQITAKSALVDLKSPSPVLDVSEEHIGKSVRLGEKEGLLKYVGSVHFAKGVWCGIELSNACGKNNGTVNGVQYFTCPELRGLMAPVAKVTLIEGISETVDGDNVSGPYSILCLEPKLPESTFTSAPNVNRTDNKTNCTYEIGKENQNCTYDLERKLEHNRIYDITNNTTAGDNLRPIGYGQTFKSRATFDIESADNLRRQVLTEQSLRHTNGSSVENLSDDDKHRKTASYDSDTNRACSTENLSSNFTYDFTKSKDHTLSVENLNQLQSNITHTINIRQVSSGPSTPEEHLASSFRNKTFELELNGSCLANSKKRTNDTFTQNEKENDFNKTFRQENINSPLEGALPYLPINKSCEDLLKESTLEVKRRRRSNSKTDITLDRALALEKNNQLYHLNQPDHSTPVRGGYSENFKSLRYSEIQGPQDNDVTINNKDILCADNSLGILSVGQIIDFTQSNADIEKLLSKVDIKRRRTSNAKSESPVHRTVTLEKPSSLPQLRIVHQLHSNGSPSNSFSNLKQLDYSNPIRIDFLDDLRKLQGINATLDNESENSKRDSLDCEESLGILTPDQMVDFTHSLDCDKLLGVLTPDQIVHFSQNQSPNVEYNPIFANKVSAEPEFKQLSPSQELHPTARSLTIDAYKTKEVYEEVQSPNLNSITDYSFGIIDPDQMLSAFTILKTDTTMNLDLPLDPVADSKDFTLTRCEETPSPEELPLDTTPIVESEPSKTEPTKSKTNSSFITSITSITSLDTGYQGDGEMSRPASRGADNSPLTRRPFPRPLPRRPDPMTDSDFYTESDADNHEDNQVKGDRRAQVIDGTLYGVDPQAAADIYVNNRENMDSSGVFTDIESGLRNDDEVDNGNESGLEHNNNKTIDVSPSDSSKTISENSQSNIHEVLQKTAKSNEINESLLDKTVKDNPKKRNAPSPGISSPSSLSSPRHLLKEENSAKKYKMPKRDVASKVKAMLVEPSSVLQDKKAIKKPVNRWDAVMNKISKNEQNKTNLKEIKSKVFDNVNLSNPNSTRNIEPRKPAVHAVANQNNKSRRIRTRTPHNSSPLKKTVGTNVQSSINSSLSDLSASTSPPKKNLGSAKKRDTIQVTQVLTPNKLSSKNQQNLVENKKNVNNINSTTPQNDIKPKRTTIFPAKEKKLQTISKESSKPTVKGGRTSPSVRPPAQQTIRAPVKKASPAPRATEALAVLVQHLVFNVEAYQVPHLRRQVEKLRLEAEEIRLAYRHLEEALGDEKLKHVAAIEEERVRCRNDITDLIEKHRNQIAQLTSQQAEAHQQLRLEKETSEQHLNHKHDEQLTTLRKELEKLQKSHEEALDILREENDCIREQIDEKRLDLEKANHESVKLKEDYETQEIKLKEEVETVKSQRDKLKHQIGKLENDFQDKMKAFVEENKRLREQNDRLLSYGDDKDIAKQEVQSLRVVLELKQNEIADLRKSLEEAKQKQQVLEGAEERAATLQARCEDLQHQLQRKGEYEQTLIQENQKLQDSFKEEINHTRRLSQHNEELQWKLRQNKEVFTKVMEQAEESGFNRSNIYSSSFNEKHSSAKSLERTLSFRESSHKSGINFDSSNRSRKSKNSLVFDEDLSPPSSPKVKGVVEKSDSVSYVLDLDESPDLVASRILRRSFRNTTPPKNTPTKSPSTKRPRIRNPLSMSASSSALLPTSKEECDRPRSASARNGNCEDDDVFLWGNGHQSTPKYHEDKMSRSCDSTNSSMKLDDNLDLDEDNEVDLQLPALPNEMDKRNGILALPSPKRLAADAAGSDSNSEDESTSSSQL